MLIDCHNSYFGHKSSSREGLGLLDDNTLPDCIEGNNSLGTDTAAGDRPGIDSRPDVHHHQRIRTFDLPLAGTPSAGSFETYTDSDTYLLADENLDLTF